MKKDKQVEYTLIAEGYAEYAFIPIYIKSISSQYNVQMVKSRLGFKGGDAGKSKVLKEAESISTAAIQKNHKLIVIGVDLDAADHEQHQPEHEVACQQIISALGKTYKSYSDRFVYFVTVQAIEQWLAYQAYKASLAEKFSDNSLESKKQSELKKLLYGAKENGPNMDRIAEKIGLAADFEELAKQSRSFKHFHNQVKIFLSQL